MRSVPKENSSFSPRRGSEKILAKINPKYLEAIKMVFSNSLRQTGVLIEAANRRAGVEIFETTSKKVHLIDVKTS